MDKEKKYNKAIKNSFHILEKATELALAHRDVEALVAISDRWTMLADRISQNDMQEIPIGFISQEKDVRDKTNHKRKS